MPVLTVEGKKHRIGEVSGQYPRWVVPVDERSVSVEVLREVESNPRALIVRAGSRVLRVSVVRTEDSPDTYLVELDGRPIPVRLEAETVSTRARSEEIQGPVLISSPMAGKIAALKTSIGASVNEGQALVVLEAMKMENEIASPKKGTVKEIYVQQGALAKPGDRLVLIE